MWHLLAITWSDLTRDPGHTYTVLTYTVRSDLH